MNIPNFIDVKLVETDGADKGRFTEIGRKFMDQLITELKKNTSECFVVPTAMSSDLVDLAVSDYMGGIVYNTDTNRLMVNVFDTTTQTYSFKNIVTE